MPVSSRFFALSVVAACAFVFSGCGCDDAPKEDLTKPPPPLEVRAVPSEIKVEVYPQKGALGPRPVAMVVAKDPSYCEKVKKSYGSAAHVLCGDGALEAVEPQLKAGAAYLKKTYPRYVAGAPVHLFVDEARHDVGWRLMLKEPGFFSHAFLAGLEEKVLTNTTLHALNSKGAQTLALTLDSSKRLKFLMEVAKRRGLAVHPLGNKPASLDEAIAVLKAADVRLNPPSPAKK